MNHFPLCLTCCSKIYSRRNSSHLSCCFHHILPYPLLLYTFHKCFSLCAIVFILTFHSLYAVVFLSTFHRYFSWILTFLECSAFVFFFILLLLRYFGAILPRFAYEFDIHFSYTQLPDILVPWHCVCVCVLWYHFARQHFQWKAYQISKRSVWLLTTY